MGRLKRPSCTKTACSHGSKKTVTGTERPISGNISTVPRPSYAEKRIWIMMERLIWSGKRAIRPHPFRMSNKNNHTQREEQDVRVFEQGRCAGVSDSGVSGRGGR